MIYLRTGANGAGKTLLTLRDVHAKALKESRPVYHNGRFEIVPDGPLHGWKHIEAKDWETVPDGAIFVFDECHNDFPVRAGNVPAPGYVKALAEHRRRGFDFFLITQHPLNIDSFVRRLIGSPGWHQHLKRASGAPLVSVLEWPAVKDQCERAGAGESGTVTMVTYPKEVYGWYRSTSLDTAKLKIPFRVWVLVFCLIAFPLGVWAAVYTFQKASADRTEQFKKLAGPTASAPGAVGAQASGNVASAQTMTRQQYLSSYQARIQGLPYTAPRYDKLTEPTEAPFPAACIAMAKRCDCYTQQGTSIPIPLATCRQIVKGGFFQDWGQRQVQVTPAGPPPLARMSDVAPVSLSPPPVAPLAAPDAVAARDGEVIGMIRNGKR